MLDKFQKFYKENYMRIIEKCFIYLSISVVIMVFGGMVLVSNKIISIELYEFLVFLIPSAPLLIIFFIDIFLWILHRKDKKGLK